MNVYAITCNQDTNALHSARFYANSELAVAALARIANDRRHKLGVQVITDSASKFSYLFGWEEVEVVFSIVEIGIIT